MMKHKKIIFALLFLLLLTGCTKRTLTIIDISPANITLYPNETQTFTVIGKAQNGEIMGITPSWSLSNNIGVLHSTTGTSITFTAKNLGETTLTVIAEGITASTTITIVEEPILTTLIIKPSTANVGIDEIKSFEAIGKDQFGNEIKLDVDPIWTVTGGIGTVEPETGVNTIFFAYVSGTGEVVASIDEISTSATVTVEPLVVFSDPNLEIIIRNELQKVQSPIFPSDLESIHSLFAWNLEISSLDGIEYCVNLKYLYLKTNNISNITPLMALTKLEELNLSYNNIEDISPLRDLSNLNIIYLSYNSIEDITPLVDNEGLDMGDYLQIEYNSLDLSEESEDLQAINALLKRGVEVDY